MAPATTHLATASTDTGGVGISGYELQVHLASDESVVEAWQVATLSGSDVSIDSGLSLTDGESYQARVRAIDSAGNRGAASALSTVWTASATINCPTGFIPVSGNSEFSTSDFCVMKYEAKDNGSGVPESVAAGTPWSNLNRDQYRTECQSMTESGFTGSFDLISHAQWQSIARDIESVASNWSDGVVGTGMINRGHSDDNPSGAIAASTDDTQGYSGTGNNSSQSYGSGGEQKRTHTLSNGEVIWDLAGNVWEFTLDDYSSLGVNPAMSASWREFTAISTDNQAIFGPSNTSWSSSQGIGQIAGGSAGAVLKGGRSNSGANAGIYTVALTDGPTSTSSGAFGFRCVYSP